MAVKQIKLWQQTKKQNRLNKTEQKKKHKKPKNFSNKMGCNFCAHMKEENSIFVSIFVHSLLCKSADTYLDEKIREK